MCMSAMHVCCIFGEENYGIWTISKFVSRDTVVGKQWVFGWNRLGKNFVIVVRLSKFSATFCGQTNRLELCNWNARSLIKHEKKQQQKINFSSLLLPSFFCYRRFNATVLRKRNDFFFHGTWLWVSCYLLFILDEWLRKKPTS